MGADCVYKPKMKWFWIMHAFLKQTDQRRETQSNLVCTLFGTIAQYNFPL
jgi:hypothetical protein